MSTSTRRIALALAAVAIAVVGGGIGAALVASTQSGGTTTVVVSSAVPVTEPASTSADASGTASESPIAAIAVKANRSVVQIEVTSTSNNGFGEQTQQAQGSGFVYDAKGHVITNAHVVSSATKVNVSFADGSTYAGSVVGTDPASDLAVVKITAPGSQLHPLSLGDSSAVRVGDVVVAVGSPFGLATTVTSGIISALNREITSPSNTPIEGAIQTDAAINHGNSGGPLFDERGRVIGVNSQIESDSGGNDGVGFAVRVGDVVVAVGSPFGLATTVTSGIVSALNREITSPSNTPIEGAIQTDAAINHGNSGGPLFDERGRVIGVNSQIESDSGGNDGVGFAVPSNTVKLIASQLIATGSADHAQLGVTVATIPAQVAGKLGIVAGVAVGTVQAGSAADTSGLKASTGTKIVGNTGYPIGGDVITAFDGVSVTTAEQLRGVIDSHRVGDRVTVTVVRAGKTRTVSVRLGRRS